MPTASDSLLRGIVRDDAITRGLGDEEGRMLVEWVVDWAELLAETTRTEAEAQVLVARLCRRARAIGRFVQLWETPRTRGAAAQLAASERFVWPLPTDPGMTPADVMEQILNWERIHCGE